MSPAKPARFLFGINTDISPYRIVYVYKITNKINGKLYIGITRTSIGDRWSKHKSAALRRSKKVYAMQTAIKKYGPENFSMEIIQICTSEEDAQKSEIKFISYFESTNPDNGYNRTNGGENFFIKHTPETIKKMSNSAKNRKLTEEGKKSLSDARKKSWQTPEYRKSMLKNKKIQSPKQREHFEKVRQSFAGRHHSEETRKRMKETWYEKRGHLIGIKRPEVGAKVSATKQLKKALKIKMGNV